MTGWGLGFSSLPRGRLYVRPASSDHLHDSRCGRSGCQCSAATRRLPNPSVQPYKSAYGFCGLFQRGSLVPGESVRVLASPSGRGAPVHTLTTSSWRRRSLRTCVCCAGAERVYAALDTLSVMASREIGHDSSPKGGAKRKNGLSYKLFTRAYAVLKFRKALSFPRGVWYNGQAIILFGARP